MSDKEILIQPTMWRAHPFTTLLAVLLVPFGVGLLFIGYWYVKYMNEKMRITDERIYYEDGILSKRRSQLRIKDIRNIQIYEGFVQRMIGSGQIAISSSGQGGMEIVINGVKKPQKVRDLLQDYQQN